MWAKLRKKHPWLAEAVEWGVLLLAVAAFLLAQATFLRAWGWL